MEFWRYYRIIRRRRWLIILGMMICIGAVAVNIQLTEKMYTGRTTVMESKGMAPERVPVYNEFTPQLDPQLRLSNLVTIATSQKVLSDAAATLGDLGLRYGPEEILANTVVQPVRDTNILAIEVTLPDPSEAKIAADVVAAEFKKVYGELHNSAIKHSREFIEAQIETTRQAMVKAQDALRKFKEQSGVVLLDQQSIAAIQRVSQAKVDLNQVTMANEGAEARLAKVDQELQGMQEWQVSATVTQRNPVWERLQEQLVDAESRKASMLNGGPGQPRRGPNHPEVIALNNQIREVKEKLVSAKEEYKKEYIASTQEAKNPNFVNALDRWLGAKVESVGAFAQREAARSVLDSMQGDLADLPAQQAKMAELETDARAATDTYALMRSKLNEAKIKEQQAKNETAIKTIDPAYYYPVNQKKSLKLMLALLVSPLLGIGVAFLLHYTDNTVKTAGDAEKLLGLPVLSAVPGARGHSLPRQTCSEAVDVAYQMLTSSLWIANQNQGVNAVVVVSAEPDVGRSVTASNLATSLAREGARVILVDADMRQPTQHLIFGVDNKAGLTNILSGAATLEDALVPTRVQGLLLVPTGPVPDNPVKLLRSQEMKEFADQIKDRELADFVVYDTPAGVTFPDPVLVASCVGNAVMVHSAGRVSRGSELEFRDRLESVGVQMLGTVLNKVRREDSSGYFHYHRSYSGVGVSSLQGGKKAIAGKR